MELIGRPDLKSPVEFCSIMLPLETTCDDFVRKIEHRIKGYSSFVWGLHTPQLAQPILLHSHTLVFDSEGRMKRIIFLISHF